MTTRISPPCCRSATAISRSTAASACAGKRRRVCHWRLKACLRMRAKLMSPASRGSAAAESAATTPESPAAEPTAAAAAPSTPAAIRAATTMAGPAARTAHGAEDDRGDESDESEQQCEAYRLGEEPCDSAHERTRAERAADPAEDATQD